MALTLSQICARALNDISSFNAPTYIIGNSNDDTATTLLSAAYKVGEELARDYVWQELSKTATYATTIGTSLYDLPADYEAVASETMWDATDQERMYGHKTRRQWAELTNSIDSVSTAYRWRLHGGRIQIHPTPDEVFTFNFEYMSRAYCQSSAGVDRPDGWVADTDVPKLPADLFIAGVHYYFSKSKTLAGAMEAGADFDAIIKTRQSRNTPKVDIDYSASVVPPRDREVHRMNIPDVIPVP